MHGIKTEIPELYILGNPPVSVVAFGAKESSGINILKVGDTMGKKGWHLNALQKPAAVHIAVTVRKLHRRSFILLSDPSCCSVDLDGLRRGYLYR